jgi:hypothetical protein
VGSKEQDALPAFAAAHPEFAKFGGWAKSAPWTGSYAEERFNSVNSFIFLDSSGTDHVVRWSLLPAAQPVALSPEELSLSASPMPTLDHGGDGRQSGRPDSGSERSLAGQSPNN